MEIPTKQDINALKRDILELEYRLSLKFGYMLTAAIAIIIALQKIL